MSETPISPMSTGRQSMRRSAPLPYAKQTSGKWEPLPHILFGFATASYEPSYLAAPSALSRGSSTNRHKRNSSTSSQSSARNRFSWSGIPSSDKGKAVDRDGEAGNQYEQALDVGDEIYAFEVFIPDLPDPSGVEWYRGYVSTPPPISQLAQPQAINDPSSSTSAAVPITQPDPSVYVGIFPSTHFHIRERLQDAEGVLAIAHAEAEERRTTASATTVSRMEPLHEEEDEEAVMDRRRPISGLNDEDWFANGTVNGKGRRSEDVTEENIKDQPPLPNLKAGGETQEGRRQPLVDEIASAIREWYLRMPVYLQKREYRVFDIVHQHIDALHMGRRQLLAQTLSVEETALLKKECVARLVKGNIAQGLEVIVRHPVNGGLVLVDPQAAREGTDGWLTAVRMYAMQVALAYIDTRPLDALLGRSTVLSPTSTATATSKAASFSLTQSSRSRRTLMLPAENDKPQITSGAFYQCFLDVRAFIASPCAPGETAELYFSLYSKTEGRFLTEEFCLIMNHFGSPARDAESRIGRLRTLFTDLSNNDIAEATYLVCRLVRNGGMKMALEASSVGAPPDIANRRGSMRSTATLTDRGTWRGSAPSIRTADRTDDSFSITSGYDGPRVQQAATNATSDDSRPSSSRVAFRRPLGCAVLELKQLTRMISDPGDATGGGEFSMPIYVPSDEASFATLHEDIIHGRTRVFERSARMEAIAVSFRIFHGVASTIISEHPSLLLDVPLTARLGFPDVVYPGSVRNDLYIKLWSGSFTPPVTSGGSIRLRKSVTPLSHLNVQVTVEVRRRDGTPMRDVLYAGGSGEPPMEQYQSLVFYHNERPTYGELVKVSIPGDIMPDCHLFLTFRNRASSAKGHFAPVDPNGLERPFAFAYLPLCSTEQACLQDGSHNLVLYKMDKNLQVAPNAYFEAPSVAAVTDLSDLKLATGSTRALSPLRDRFSVRSFLCSTQHTQSASLLAFLDWQQYLGSNIPALLDNLKAFAFVSEEEIVKFLPDVFDALFSILGYNLGNREVEIDDLAFTDLLGVLAIVSDRRFKNFQSVLDVYIDGGHFNSPASSWQILKQIKKLCEAPKSKEFRQMLKVWDQLTRFVIKGRELDRARGLGLDATSAHVEADFQRQLKSILSDINLLMASDDPADIGAQTLALQHYADVLPIFARVFQPVELAEIVIDFMDALSKASSKLLKRKMAIWKLLLLLQVVRHAFGQSDARAMLVPALVRWIKPHLGSYDELVTVSPGDSRATKDTANVHWLECNRLAVTVVALMLDKLQEWMVSPLIVEDRSLLGQEEDNVEYCLSLMPKLLASYTELSHPRTTAVIDRHSANSPISKAPDVFPSTYPFALMSLSPDSSLLARGRDAADIDGPGKPLHNCGLGELAVIILTLVLACPRARLSAWIAEMLEMEGPRNVSTFLRSFFDFASSVLNHEAFPSDWLNTSLMAHTVTIRMLEPVGNLLEKAFVPTIDHAASFDGLLWGECLGLLCQLMASDELIIEEFPAQKRRAVWTLAGDLRGEGAVLLARLWNCLGWPEAESAGAVRSGGYQVQFTFLIEYILTLCLSHHDQLRSVAVNILFSMIVSEFDRQGGSFPSIEAEVFAKVDQLFANSRDGADPVSRAYFVAQLRIVAETAGGDNAFRNKVGSFLDELESFLDLLLSLRDLPDSVQWTDERSGATLRLMDFIRRIGREDMYVAYVHQLVQANVDNDDWLGAGLALKLHADLYEWTTDGDVVEAFEYGKFDLPPQTQFARKESLYYLILDYLGQAEAYEIAIDICQELAKQHETQTFNYGRLSDLLMHQARLYERINDTTRAFPEYFRIAYFGGFPEALRGKQFIARGQPWQKFGAFCESIQEKHPTALLHRSMVAPSEVVQNGDDLVIWITGLTPEPDLSRPALCAPTVSENIQSYWRHCDVDTFSCQRSYRSTAHDGTGENDILDLWIEKTILTASHRFPHVLGRAEIVKTKTVQISPLAAALHELRKVTASMVVLADKYRVLDQTGETADTRRLSMALNSAVDSPISGGVPAYRKAFLDPAYLLVRPQDTARVDELREAILSHVKAIEVCLDLHDRLRPPEMASFHEALVGFYHRSFPGEIEILKIRQSMQASLQGSSIPHRSVHTPSVVTPYDAAEQTLPSQLVSMNGSNSLHSSGRAGDFQLPPLQMYPGTYDTSLVARPVVTSPASKKPPVTPCKSRRGSAVDSPVKSGRRSFTSGRADSPAGSYVSVPPLGGAPYSATDETGKRTKQEGMMRFGSLLRKRG